MPHIPESDGKVLVYLSGPMTGYEDLNRSAFHAAAEAMRNVGYAVVSPAEIEDGPDWDSCLKADLREMLTCDCITQLGGWEASRGARLEAMVSIAVGIPNISLVQLMRNAPHGGF